jgi:predicted RNase H-like nuclease
VTRVLGVDGCRRGWVAVALEGGRFATARFAARFADLVDDEATIIGVDIPLGSNGAVRAADGEARRLLGRRGVTVFDAPPGDVLDAPDHATANRWCRERHGRGLSAQAWNLVPKMRDVEPHWHEAPQRIFEVHPELSFATMGDAVVEEPKQTWAGHRTRARLLADAGIRVPDELGTAGAAGPDDVLDAAAVAWSAARIAAGEQRSVPDPVERDAADRPIAIWF